MKPTWTITRTTETTFAATSDIPMSDGTFRRDAELALDGNVLRSVERRGYYRVGGLLRLTLGGASLAAITGLAVGQSIILR